MNGRDEPEEVHGVESRASRKSADGSIALTSISGAMLPSSSCTTDRISAVLTVCPGLLQQLTDLGEEKSSGVSVAHPVVGRKRSIDKGPRHHGAALDPGTSRTTLPNPTRRPGADR